MVTNDHQLPAVMCTPPIRPHTGLDCSGIADIPATLSKDTRLSELCICLTRHLPIVHHIHVHRITFGMVVHLEVTTQHHGCIRGDLKGCCQLASPGQSTRVHRALHASSRN